MLHRRMFTLLLAVAGIAVQAAEPGAPPRPSADRLILNASASTEVARDILSITFSTTKEGADAAAVQKQLKQALDTALAEARKIAKPGEVDVQTGNFALSPRYSQRPGAANTITGWQGSAELLVEGRDTTAIAQLSGRISTMSIARVGYSLSREQREKVEGDVAGQAIARFRAKAAEYAKLFGYGSYGVAEVSVNSDDAGPQFTPQFRLGVQSSLAVADAALPVEAGKARVTVTVSGTVILGR